jgi:hypothetical protein
MMNLHLPSWVPDWRLSQEFNFADIFTVHSPELVFCAAADTEAKLCLLPYTRIETLVVQGFTYDICQAAGASAANIHSNWPRVPSSAHFDSRNALEATASFCRTACGNHLLVHDWSCAEALPLRELILFRELLYQYYKHGTLLELRAPDTRQSILLPYFGDFYRELDKWAILSIHGHRLKDWILATGLSNSMAAFKSVDEITESAKRLRYTLSMTLARKKIVDGERRGISLVPEEASPGDKICILTGCDFPIVLREHEGKNIVIGVCYVDGIMHGEAMREYFRNYSALEEFFIM